MEPMQQQYEEDEFLLQQDQQYQYQADGGYERVPPGYPYLTREPTQMFQRTQPRKLSFGSLGLRQRPQSTRRAIQAREQALRNPRMGFNYQYPAYTRFLGSPANAYPPQFAQVYGSGAEPTHYYPGLTPRDVLLATTSRKSVTQSAYATPMVLRRHEIMQSRSKIDAFSSIFYEGYLPSNDDILHFLYSFRDALNRRAQISGGSHWNDGSSLTCVEFSQEAYNIIDDLLDVTYVLENLLKSKNPDETLQRFIHHTVLSARSTADYAKRMRAKKAMLGLDVEEEAQTLKSAMGGIVPQLFRAIGSGQFGSVLQDIWNIISEIANTPGTGYEYGAAPAARIAPAPAPPVMMTGNIQSSEPVYVYQQEYEQFDRAMPQQFVADGGQQYTLVEEHMLPSEQTTAYPARAPRTFAQTEGPVDASFQPQIAKTSALQRGPAPMLGGRDYISGLASPLNSRRLFELMDKLRAVLLQIMQIPSVETILKLFTSTIADLGAIPSLSQVQGTVMFDDANRQEMMKDLKVIVESFCGRSLDPIIDILDGYQYAYANDWELRDYVQEVGSFLSRCVADIQYLQGLDYLPKAANLVERGRQFFSERYPSLTNALLNEIFGIIQGLQSDPDIGDLRDVMSNLFQDLFVNPSSGQFQLKTSLFQDFKNVYLPILMQTIRYIPLPHIAFSDQNYDMTFDNVVIIADNLIPNMLEFKVENQVQVSPRPDLPDTYILNILTLDILQIQADVKNVEFAYRKKTFPRMEDDGLADLLLGGNGLSIHLRVAYDPNLWYTTLIPLDIDVTIDTLRLKLHDSGRDALYKVFGPALMLAAKKRICRAIEKRIFDAITAADGVLTNLGQATGKKKILGLPSF